MYLEGRKDMVFKERLVEGSVCGNGSRPGGPVSLSPFFDENRCSQTGKLWREGMPLLLLLLLFLQLGEFRSWC